MKGEKGRGGEGGEEGVGNIIHLLDRKHTDLGECCHIIMIACGLHRQL